MAKLREGEPWMPGFRYGALLPPLSLNLLVRDTERSVAFYRAVFDAECTIATSTSLRCASGRRR